jgi:deazaflavin-dependent oxidoreductase (nitroreductase family)
MSGGSIPPVDPTKPRPIRKALVDPLVVTSFGRWWLLNVAPRLDPAFFKLSGGRFTSLPAPILFLVHTGAHSGKTRETPLVYFSDGEDLVVMASNYGREKHPAWFYNVKANPEVEVRAGGRQERRRARITAGEDRQRLYELAKRITRAYDDYERRAAREIQVIRLSPVADAAT